MTPEHLQTIVHLEMKAKEGKPNLKFSQVSIETTTSWFVHCELDRGPMDSDVGYKEVKQYAANVDDEDKLRERIRRHLNNDEV